MVVLEMIRGFARWPVNPFAGKEIKLETIHL
jgi:hypothetical protein